MTVAIKIAGTDYVDHVVYRTARFESAVNGATGPAFIRVRDDDRSLSFATGQSLELLVDGNPVWTGYIQTVSRVYVFDALNVADAGLTRWIDLTGTDINILLTKRFVFKQADPVVTIGPTFPAHTADTTALTELFANWLDLSGDSLDTSSGITGVGDINEDQAANVWFAANSLSDAIGLIAALPAAVYFIRPDRVVVYTDVNTADAPYAMSDQPSSGQSGYREMNLVFDGGSLANDVLAWGVGYGGQVFDRDEDTTSQTAHGLWQFGQVSYGIYKQSTIDRVADSILNGSPTSHRGAKDNRVSVECVTYQSGFLPAQKVDFTSNIFGFNDVIPIRRMVVTFEAVHNPRYELTLSHEIDTPFGFFDQFLPKLPGFTWPKPNPPVGPKPPIPGGCDCGITDSFDRTTVFAFTPTGGWGVSTAGRIWNNLGTPGSPAYVNGAQGILDLDGTSAFRCEQVLPFDERSTLEAILSGLSLTGTSIPESFSNRGTDIQLTFGTFFGGGSSHTIHLLHNWFLGFPVFAPLVSGWTFDDGIVHSLPDAFFDSPFNVRVQSDGVTFDARVWTAADAEPSVWITDSDTTPTTYSEVDISVGNNTGSHPILALDSLDITDVNRCTEYRFDNFNRTVSGGWGTSDFGEAWQSTGATLSVDGTQALLSPTSSVSAGNYVALGGAANPNESIWLMQLSRALGNSGSAGETIDFFIDDTGSGGVTIELGRRLDSGSYGAGRVGMSVSGTSVGAGPGVSLTDPFFMAATFTGTTIEFRIWAATGTRPTSPTCSVPQPSQTYDQWQVQTAVNVTTYGAFTGYIDYIDFDYTGKPCYNVCTTPATPLVIGGNDDKAAKSNDGTSWSVSAPGFSGSTGVNAVRGIAWSPELSLFVAVGPQGPGGAGRKGEAATSADGSTWTVHDMTLASPTFMRAICWSSELSLFVAVGGNGSSGNPTVIATSPDGVTWTTRTDPFSASFREANCVAWAPNLNLFVLGADSTLLATSSDGITWTPRTSGYSSGAAVSSVAWSPAVARLVIGSGGGGVRYSSDGLTWFAASVSVSGVVSLAWSPELSLFAAGRVGVSSGVIATSPDGNTWTTRTTPFSAFTGVNAMAWSSDLGLFVAGGTGGQLATSPDGITWTSRTSGFSTSSIAVAVGATGLCTPVPPTPSSPGGPLYGNTCEVATRTDSTHYQLSVAYTPGSSQVYVGTPGLLVRRGITLDYTEDPEGGVIIFNDPVTDGTRIYVCMTANGDVVP